jgi:predicted Ser/Thr protein kinase
LDYLEEKRIYEEQINGLKDVAIFEPHSLETLCLFAVMTRLRPCDSKNYLDKNMSKIAAELNPLQKALLLSSDQVLPENLDVESKQILKQFYDDLLSEHELENLYEGKFGISPRDIKKSLYELAQSNKNVTFLAALEYLKRLVIKKSEYDFLNMTPQGDYHHCSRFIGLLEAHFLDQFDSELRDSLGLIDQRSYEDYLKKYISNINAQIKGEKLKNEITGQFVACDVYFITEFEKNIDLKEDAKRFRSHLISKLGAYSLDNPGKTIVYTDVFVDLVTALKESFRNEQKRHIELMSKNLVFYEAELTQISAPQSTPMSEKDRQQIRIAVENLCSKYHYTQQGAIELLKHLIKTRY